MAENNIDEIDPIKASYDVYLQPRVHTDRQVYVLQYPNRSSDKPYNTECHSQPLKLRVKPNSGMVEIDVPIDTYNNYDRYKGVEWGEALKESTAAKGKGSHGLPGGFGIGGIQPRGRGRGKTEEDEREAHLATLRNFAGAIEREQALGKQTLGGQAVANSETNPKYMVGIFRKNQLHLTPVDHMVQMRPQFHHIDALAEHKKLFAARDSAAGASVTRAIHMTVKSSIDGEEDSTDTMAQRIAATQAEDWEHHHYIDENTDESWTQFEHFYIGDNGDEALERLPRLATALLDNEYLDAVSAPGDEARLSRSTKTKKGKGKGKEMEVVGTKGEAIEDESSGVSDIDEEPAPERPADEDVTMSEAA
ncbi:DNA-directed RNA polymerase III subunit Rpc5 [Amylocarpus encephaloides]|uniref:DNA-directed RNA polymerase III subunit Rpc5 n=1 Tax=Amylocarpus encephaloides TaxID=45428 RepID=A0A9P7YMK1_9HELO|nr:DNA-directed RNA polymerase III subunit Rpc5 [Amylocarpus encephaloides]